MRGRRSSVPRWRRRQRARRAAIAALLIVGALAAAADLVPGAAGRSVVLAARDLPAGTRLTSGDLDVAALPASSPLAGAALEEADVLGRTTVGPVPAGEMVTASRLFGDDGAAATPGYTTMPVVFDEPAIASFLAPGMVVDLLWTPGTLDDGGAQVVARGARVVGMPDGTQSGMLGGGAQAPPVLVEVRTGDAATTAAALGTGSLTVALHRGAGSGLPAPSADSKGRGPDPPEAGDAQGQQEGPGQLPWQP